MGLFEFILILVFLVLVFEAGTKLLMPVSRRLADLISDMVDERRGVRADPRTAAPPSALPDASLEELEDRLARVEDRLAFLEELKAAPRQRALGQAEVPTSADFTTGVAGGVRCEQAPAARIRRVPTVPPASANRRPRDTAGGHRPVLRRGAAPSLHR